MPFPLKPPVVLTDDIRAAVLAEMRAHCAPSTWDRLVASLRANGYPLNPTALNLNTDT